MVESEIESKMRDRIKERGGIFIKFISPSSRGVPDRIVLAKPGRIIFVELKREGETPTALQRHWQKILKSFGFDARVIIGMEEAMSFVEEVFPE
jgi:hypothetical protein